MNFSLRAVFPQRPPLIAMIHVPALPGTPVYNNDWPAILEKVAAEAELLSRVGVDALILENMHDTPYLARQVGPEIVSSMTAVALRVKATAPHLPCGIQILAGANRAALAVALAADLQFIRAEGFVFGHVADEGWLNSDAANLLRYRRQIGAEHIAVYTDLKKKHSSHAITADVSLAETAKAAAFFRTDGLIVTGTATGTAAKIEDVASVKQSCPHLPLLIGSGITPENVHQYRHLVDGFIVGSALKQGGHWANELDEELVRKMVNAVKEDV
jgi:hypothetical protein